MEKRPHLALAKKYWQEHLRPTDGAIDATCGNGHDTLFLSHQLGQGVVWGFDIQPEAIRMTGELVRERKNVQLYQFSHARLLEMPLPFVPRLIVYNLGYLPGGDKSIVTRSDTTVESLEQAASLIGPGGAISVVCYPGHPEGAMEEQAVFQWAERRDPHIWETSLHRWINRAHSPSFLWMRKAL